ncbi:MAG: hypothetical protein ABSH56_21530 [Bryobacteraceae bacterium]|jgi:transposase InsO family protein
MAASIGILVMHTPPYQPDGRGKIERFFRSSIVDNRYVALGQTSPGGMQLASQVPKMLAGVIEINDLNSTGKVPIGEVPDPV